jgi:hypothetical protein
MGASCSQVIVNGAAALSLMLMGDPIRLTTGILTSELAEE